MKKEKNEKSIKNDFKKLEEIINKLEGKEIDLEKSLNLFKEGSELVKKCHNQLKKAKNKFREIKMDLDKELE